MKQRIFTLRQIIEEGRLLLEAAGIEEAATDAWYLAEYVTGISRAAYYGEPDRVVEERQVKKYLEYIETRRKRIPLQHITGEQEFMGYPFYVDKHVLIPRQDTEILVEEGVKVIRSMGREVKVLDMCTGSGCILLSILKMCPLAAGTGCDISDAALCVAKKNAKRLGVEARWVRSDLFGQWKVTDECEGAESVSDMRYDMIISNPPYIRTAEIEELQEEVRIHDPRIALDGGEDGLEFYRRIIKDSIPCMEEGGYLLVEIGCGQGKDVSKLMQNQGYKDIKIKKDLSGLDRVVMGRYNKIGQRDSEGKYRIQDNSRRINNV